MFEFEDYIKFTVGEVVPAREGLRLLTLVSIDFFIVVGEVVPAREGLRRKLSQTDIKIRVQSERLFQLEKD